MKWRGALPKKANSKQIDPLSDFFIEKVPPLPRGTVHTVQRVQNSVTYRAMSECNVRIGEMETMLTDRTLKVRGCAMSASRMWPRAAPILYSLIC